MIYQSVLDGKRMKEDDFPFIASPPHIRHCVDLLRQSLMCRPDTTIEIKDDELGGVIGFGTKHQCRDWDQLVAWTSKWESFDKNPRNKTILLDSHSHNHHYSKSAPGDST